MSMIYVDGNLITVSTLDSVSTEDTVYVKENLYNERQGKPFRFTAKSGCYVLIDLGGATQVKFVSLCNHNLLLTGAGFCKIKAAAANPPAGGDWDSPDYEAAITQNDVGMYKTLDETYQYWYLDIDDPDNTENPEIGELILRGTYTQFTRNFVYPYTEIKEFFKTSQITQYGQRWQDRKSIFMRYLLDFPGVTDANLIAETEAFFDAIDADPFIFIPDDSGANCWYGVAVNSLEARRESYNYNSFTLEFEEQARGITLL